MQLPSIEKVAVMSYHIEHLRYRSLAAVGLAAATTLAVLASALITAL